MDNTIRGREVIVGLVCLLAVVLSGCGPSTPEGAGREGPLPVMVSVTPYAFLVETIGGEGFKVAVLAKEDQSPETYEVSPRQMDQLSRAVIFFRAGLPFESPLLPKLTAMSPELRIVDLRDGVELLGGDDHAHAGAPHVHEAEAADPHVWLDPMRMKQQARVVTDALVALVPSRAGYFEERCTAIEEELDALHARIGERLAGCRGRRMYVYHPAYGYFAAAYGIEQVALEIDGKSPGARRVNELCARIKDEGVRALFVQPQFSQQEAEAIAEATGALIVVLAPLSKDYVANLDALSRRVAAVIEGDA